MKKLELSSFLLRCCPHIHIPTLATDLALKRSKEATKEEKKEKTHSEQNQC